MSKLKYVRNVDWKDRLFGIKCPHCKKRGDMRRDQYLRGWNNECEQGSGEEGYFCMSCQRITFLTSFEEARRVTPAWCTVHPDSDRAKWFPDFKHNRDVSRIPTHLSHSIKPEPEPVTPPSRSNFGWWPQHSRLIQ